MSSRVTTPGLMLATTDVDHSEDGVSRRWILNRGGLLGSALALGSLAGPSAAFANDGEEDDEIVLSEEELARVRRKQELIRAKNRSA